MVSMKKILLLSIIGILMVPMVLAAGPGGVHEPGTGMGSPMGEAGNYQAVETDPEQNILSESEIAGLKLMREEEKLARDVYLALYEKWGMPIFNNIAKSEQTHTDAVKTLLDLYGIGDPASVDQGIFTDQELQTLYDDLVNKGDASLLEALIVGATIEDLDIKDLNELIAQTENQDILLVYNNLRKGSRNHMRSFVRQIENNGGTYTAQFIEQSELDEILGSPQESGPMLDENSNIIPRVSPELRGPQEQRGMLQSGNYQVSGGRMMNVQQQANNRMVIQTGAISVDCSPYLEMTQERAQNETKIYAKLSNGRNAEIKIMPDMASRAALQRLNLRNCTDDCNIELKEANLGNQVRAVYEVRAQRNSKVFGIFSARMQVQAQVDAETGEIIQVNKPWWAFLAVEPEE